MFSVELELEFDYEKAGLKKPEGKVRFTGYILRIIRNTVKTDAAPQFSFFRAEPTASRPSARQRPWQWNLCREVLARLSSIIRTHRRRFSRHLFVRSMPQSSR